MKKKLILIYILILTAMLIGCNMLNNPNNIGIIVSSDYYSIKLEETLDLPILINDESISYKISDENVASLEGNIITALNEGSAVIYAYNSNNQLVKEYVINVTSNFTGLTIKGSSFIKLNSEETYTATITPSSLSQEVIWKSSDTSILKIDENGLATGVGEGLATITVSSKNHPDYTNSITVLVAEKINSNGGITNEETSGEIILDGNGLTSLFYPLIEEASSYVIGVNSYKTSWGKETLSSIGSGVIYRREIVLRTGETIAYDENVDTSLIKNYKYHVITNKHVVVDGSKFTIYASDIHYEIEAKLIQYDSKIDLAVLTFESGVYFNVAKFGDSDNLERGEFCIAIGHPFGYELANSANFGIISYPERYISDDTDGDGVSDWDAEYLQHDAAINEGNSGGPLINLKGEVVGINTLKLSSVTVEDMGFAIPSNATIELVSFLEKGQVPQRPLLVVEALEVKTIITSESLMQQYPIPEGLTYGIYIATVSSGGVASQAGILPGDVLVSINGVDIYYTYLLRAELGKFIIGSGQKCELIVYRGNEKIVLTATF